MTDLVIDLGGVLFHFDHARRLARMTDVFALPPERLDELLWKSGFSAACDAGEYADAKEVRERIRDSTGFSGSDEELDTAWCSAFRPDLRVSAALKRHRGSLSLFTNNGPLEEEMLLRLYPTVFDGFGHLLFSHRLGYRKPDPAAFRAAAARLGAHPRDILFIDDSSANVDAARRQGWSAIPFQGPETISETLH